MADTKTIYKKMLRLVLPISFQQFMLALVGASDAIMLGKLNQDSMSAATLWCITVPLGCTCAFVCRFPVMVVYFVLNLDEIVKLPAVYWHYKKYGWVKNIINGGFEHE